ncbi:MAG: 3-deoxy-D-manno-octulosonic acid transferase [Planktomarina sp.]
MNAPAQSTLPCVWAHCGNDNAIGAMRDIETRMNASGDIVRFLITLPRGTSTERRDYIALDHGNAFAFHAILDEHKPSISLWAEVDIIASGLNACHKRNVPTLLIEPPSDSISKRSWLWRKTTLKSALKQIDQVTASDDIKEVVWKNFGAPHVVPLPNLQEAILPPSFNEAERDTFAQIIGSRPVWFIDGLPLQEAGIIIAAIQEAQRSWPRLITFVEPQTPAMHTPLRAAFEKAGLTVHERSREGEPDNVTQVFMTDGPDEAGLWYRLAPLCYMGGTIMGQKCPNPLIPASLGSAILHGHRIQSHKSAFATLANNDATGLIEHGQHMGNILAAYLSPDQAANKASAAWDVATSGAETAEYIAAFIADKLALNWVG